jgi:hypothetical protein
MVYNDTSIIYKEKGLQAAVLLPAVLLLLATCWCWCGGPGCSKRQQHSSTVAPLPAAWLTVDRAGEQVCRNNP